MIEIDIRYGKVFEKTCDAFDQGKEVVIHKGGTGSGKTEDILIYLLFYVAFQQSNLIITIVSESRPHLEIGAIRILKKYLLKSNNWSDERFNISASRYIAPTGSIIEFFSADRIGKALGARRDWLFGNEINSLKIGVWDELARRSRYIIGDFNPTAEFWLEEWLKDYPNHAVIKSNYLDNPFIPKHERDRIILKASHNENFKRVHIDCEYGITEGCIFENWHTGEFDRSLPEIFGLDFGFNDPDACVKTAIDSKRKIMYWDERIYKSGNTPEALKMQLSQTCTRNNLIIADCADQRMINTLKRYFNIKPVNKVKWTVSEALRLMQDYEHIVTPESVNLIKELRGYAWSDRKAGVPIDDFNHLIDAGRYAFMESVNEPSPQVWHGSKR